MTLIRRFRRALSRSGRGSGAHLFAQQTRIYCRVQLLIRAFYAFYAFLAISLIPDWNFILGRANEEPLWPVLWMNHVDLRVGIQAILIVFTGGSVLAAVLPQLFLVRVVAFIGVFEYWAFNNSLGKIGHSFHLLVLVSFVLIFLPRGWDLSEQRSRLIKQTTILVFWAVQSTIMMTYSMAGLIKILAGFLQISRGQPNVFLPDALARHVADRLLQTHSDSWYGSWLIEHLWVSYPLMLSTVYLELFALLTVFRPRLQPAFVIGLVVFHISSYFTMTIIFPQNCFLLFLFFAGMPLLRGPWNWRGFWLDWPIFGDLVSLGSKMVVGRKIGKAVIAVENVQSV